MAETRKSLGTIILVVLAIVLLFALNPTKEDFIAWRSGRAQDQATAGTTSGLTGVMKKGAGAIAGAMTGLVATGVRRKDYLICSSYALGSDRYLGIAHLFIKLK